MAFAYTAHLAAVRGSTEKQIKKSLRSLPLLEKAKEHISTICDLLALARAQARRFIQSDKDGLNTPAQVKEQPPAADPLKKKRFVSQGPYRARMYLKYGIS